MKSCKREDIAIMARRRSGNMVGGDEAFPTFCLKIPGNVPENAENSTQAAQALTSRSAQNRPKMPNIPY
jgi:hypothetical protein